MKTITVIAIIIVTGMIYDFLANPVIAGDYEYNQLQIQLRQQEFRRRSDAMTRQMQNDAMRQNERNNRIHEQTNYQRNYNVPKAPNTWENRKY